jgi:DNA-binding NtrC family response regulator
MPWRIALVQGEGAPFDAVDFFGSFEHDRLDIISIAPPELQDTRADLVFVVTPSIEDAWFRSLSQTPAVSPVFAMLPANTNDALLRLAGEVTADFVIEPARPEEIWRRVTRILGEPSSSVSALEDRLMDEAGLRHLVGRDPAFRRVIAQIPLIARSNCSVLVTGETGTGKELCARAIHHLSRRRESPFIPIDCGAFPDQLFENEMFGHARGAYTDAHREQRGLVAMAEGGTLFLDEIDSLSPAAQAKLLRFLQERTYRPLGGDRFVQANVTIVAATNRHLESLVAEQTFRADLFFRLSVLRLHIIPLRERREDIGLLAQHFLDAICTEQGVPRKTIAPAALVELRHQAWPGNVRELHNVVQRAFVFAPGAQLLRSHIVSAQGGVAAAAEPRVGYRAARERALRAFERQYIIEMLTQHNGNITQAARGAGQDRRAFGRLVKRHGIDRLRLTT